MLVVAETTTVQGRLRDVQHSRASVCAFAAVLADGSVLTRGDPSRAGDSSWRKVQEDKGDELLSGG